MLAEFGYLNASFARIGKHAGISPSLISYHFENKEELCQQVFLSLSIDRLAYLQGVVDRQQTWTDKLYALLEADIRKTASQPKQFQASVEVIFGMRNEQGAMVYDGDVDNPLFLMWLEILQQGQKAGEFGDFDAYCLTQVVEGARDTFLAQLPLRPSFDMERFIKTLHGMVARTVAKT